MKLYSKTLYKWGFFGALNELRDLKGMGDMPYALAFFDLKFK